MAKQKKAAAVDEDAFFTDLASDTGGEVLKGSGDSRYFIDSGNLAVNWANSGRFFGGGFPTGITEVFGPSSSAKSLMGYTVAGACQRMGGISVWWDSERATNEEFAKSAGHVDEGKLIVFRPKHIEECRHKVMEVTKKIRAAKGPDIPILHVWDSIGVAMCEREWKEQLLPPNYTKEQYKTIVGGREQPGERAKAAGTFLRIINPFLDDHNASMFVINQIRDKIGVMYGSPETTAGGGKGLPFYANTRVRSSASKSIFDKKRSTATNKVACGVNLKFANKKARSCAPFRVAEGVVLYFDKGIDPLSGLLVALINAGRIEGKGSYKVNEPWAGGQDIKFKASLVDNRVPLDILYACPSLIDAKSPEEIKSYLGVFAEALEVTPDDVEEVDVKDEDMDDEEEDAIGKLGIESDESEE